VTLRVSADISGFHIHFSLDWSVGRARQRFGNLKPVNVKSLQCIEVSRSAGDVRPKTPRNR